MSSSSMLISRNPDFKNFSKSISFMVYEDISIYVSRLLSALDPLSLIDFLAFLKLVFFLVSISLGSVVV